MLLARHASASCVNWSDFMRVVGRAATPQYARDVAVKDGIAYVGAYSAIYTKGLRIVDVTNPQSPAVIGAIDGMDLFGVALAEPYLFGVDGDSMWVFDVSNPRSPRVEWALDLPGLNYWDVATDGYYVYAPSANYLKVVEVTADGPVVRASLSCPGVAAQGIELRGSYAYIATWYGGLLVVDISDPLYPTLVRAVPTQTGYNVSVVGNHAYVAAGDRLEIVDVSIPTQAVIVGTYLTASEATNAATASGNLAFVGWFGQMLVLDVTNPADPRWVGDIAPGDGMWEIVIDAGVAYVADHNEGLVLVDVTGPASHVVGNLPLPRYPVGLDVSGDYAYLGLGTWGVRIIDVSNPASPVNRGQVDTPGEAQRIRVRDNIAYVADQAGDLQILDIADPDAPRIASSYAKVGHCLDVALAGNYAYLVDGFSILDITQPTAPVQLGYLTTLYNSRRVEVSGAYAYVIDRDQGLVVVDVHDPSAPLIAAAVHPSNWEPLVVEVLGDRAYVAHSSRDSNDYTYYATTVLDVSNPASPRVLWDLPRTPLSPPFTPPITCLAVEDAFVYQGVAQGRGIYLCNATTSPGTLVGSSVPPFSPVDLVLANGFVYAADAADALVILTEHCDPATDVRPPDTERPMVFRIEPAWPNPTSASAGVRFFSPAAGAVRFEVFDVAGRCVRRFVEDAGSAGWSRTSWDGRNDAGRRVAAGTYLLRGWNSSGRASTRVTVLR